MTETQINFEILPDIEPDLTIFEENLTANGLIEIQKESLTFPVKAINKEEYKFIYDQHQRFKRLHIAIRKRADELKLEEKSTYKEKTKKIDTDLDLVLKVISPIIGHLSGARDFWDSEIAAHKENDARDAAVIQKLEFERREKIRLEAEATAEAERIYSAKWDRAHAENEIFDEHKRQALKDEELKAQQEKLEQERLRMEQERREFEIEKGRLSFDMAWSDWHTQEEENKESRLNFDDAWEESQSDDAWGVSHITESLLSEKFDGISISNEPTNRNEFIEIGGAAILSGSVAQMSTEIDNFQQIMTEVNEEPEPLTDENILEQIRLSAGILQNELSKHIDEGFQSQASGTKVYNFFLTLKMFISDISDTDA